jgi:hypothetical protein
MAISRRKVIGVLGGAAATRQTAKPWWGSMPCVLCAKSILLIALAVVAVIVQIHYPDHAIKAILGLGVLAALIAILVVDVQ